MARGLWDVFVSLFRRSSADTDEDGDSRFVPSPLDLSIRVAHGGRDDEVERELSKIDEQARAMDDGERR